MPTYAFRCQSCGNRFEVETSWSQKGETRCPECGSSSLKENFGMYTLTVLAPSADGEAAPACACGNPMGGCGLGIHQ